MVQCNGPVPPSVVYTWYSKASQEKIHYDPKRGPMPVCWVSMVPFQVMCVQSVDLL